MTSIDPQLERALKYWPDLPSSSEFEHRVWIHIRAQSPEPGFLATLRTGLEAQPACASVLALFASTMLGLALAVAAIPPPAAPTTTASILRPGAITSAYVRIEAEGISP